MHNDQVRCYLGSLENYNVTIATMTEMCIKIF